MTAPIEGSGKGSGGWVRLDAANLGYDHATHTSAEHALLLDFVDSTSPGVERVALEMSIASGKALAAKLLEVIDAAERSGAPE